MRAGRTHQGTPRFAAVLLDWRGTLVVAPTYALMVATALGRLGRDASPAAVDRVLDRLRAADGSAAEAPEVDLDPQLHRAAHVAWFADAGLGPDLAETLYRVGDEPELNPFAEDAGDTLAALHDAGVRIGILSDIHVDLRPFFARHRQPDGTSWADLVDVWALSFELGAVKPDPAAFTAALDRLALPAQDVLMVGDRGAWDGGAAAVGITTLLLPPLRDTGDRRLDRVVDLVLPGVDRRVPGR